MQLDSMDAGDGSAQCGDLKIGDSFDTFAQLENR